MRTIRMLAFANLIVAVLVSSAFAASPKQTGEKQESQAIYKAHCAMCHGQDAKGTTPVGKAMKIPDLLSPTVQQKTDAQLKEVIDNGKGKMPGFKSKLKAEQVQDVVGYLRDLAKTGTGKK